MSIYGSISYFSRKLDETAEIVSSSNPLNLMQKKNTIKNSLNFQVTKVNSTNITLIDKKIHCFSMTKTGKKEKDNI